MSKNEWHHTKMSVSVDEYTRKGKTWYRAYVKLALIGGELVTGIKARTNRDRAIGDAVADALSHAIVLEGWERT